LPQIDAIWKIMQPVDVETRRRFQANAAMYSHPGKLIHEDPDFLLTAGRIS
jgi:hypothetical protein